MKPSLFMGHALITIFPSLGLLMIFRYEAKDRAGKTITGSLEADNERTAASLVRDMGYFPMRFNTQGLGNTIIADTPLRPTVLTEKKPRTSSQVLQARKASASCRPYGTWLQRSLIFPISTGVSAKDLSVFYCELAAMLKAGIPVTRCLETLSGNHASGQLGIGIRGIAKRVGAGDTLSHAFSEFPHLFSELDREMIAAGEENGHLDLMVLLISQYLEREFALREIIKRESFLPKIVIVGAVFLPPLFVIVLGGFTAYFKFVIVPAILTAGFLWAAHCAMRVSIRKDSMRYAVDKFKSYIPWFGGTSRLLALAQFARIFGSFIAEGMPMPSALAASANLTGNAFFSRQIAEAAEVLASGATLSQALSSTNVFSQQFLSMVHTVEATGNLSATLTETAESYESEAEIRIHQSVNFLLLRNIDSKRKDDLRRPMRT